MIYAAFIILLFLLTIAALLMILRQTRCVQRLERQVKTQDKELDRAFNRNERLNVRVSALEDAEDERKKRDEEFNSRVSALEDAEEQRKKRDEELAEAEAQMKKAQEIEKLWQDGMEHIQAYDYDAAIKAVTGNAGE